MDGRERMESMDGREREWIDGGREWTMGERMYERERGWMGREGKNGWRLGIDKECMDGEVAGREKMDDRHGQNGWRGRDKWLGGREEMKEGKDREKIGSQDGWGGRENGPRCVGGADGEELWWAAGETGWGWEKDERMGQGDLERLWVMGDREESLLAETHPPSFSFSF
jgi:hypothetical protein